MMKKITLLICLIVLTSACTFYHINSEETTDKALLPKKSADDVTYAEEITQPHEIIGSITVTADRSNQRMDTIIERMKREAAILGGDAITNMEVKAPGGLWEKIPAKKLLGNAYIRANYTANVVVFQ